MKGIVAFSIITVTVSLILNISILPGGQACFFCINFFQFLPSDTYPPTYEGVRPTQCNLRMGEFRPEILIRAISSPDGTNVWYQHAVTNVYEFAVIHNGNRKFSINLDVELINDRTCEREYRLLSNINVSVYPSMGQIPEWISCGPAPIPCPGRLSSKGRKRLAMVSNGQIVSLSEPFEVV